MNEVRDRENGGPGYTLVRLSDVAPERVTWLWPGRIPAGKITTLDGDPGLGKSTMALDLAARISTGAPMPDGSGAGDAAGVVILSAEDGLADTIRPRLEAGGADASRIVAFTAVRGDDGRDRMPTLPVDLDRLEAAIADVGARLVIIDVLMAYLDGEVNAHRDQDVRRALAPLASLADRTGVAVLVLRHLNKQSAAAVLYRGGGSIGIVGAARSALVVGRDPGNEDRCALASLKSNLGPIPPAITYRIVDFEGTARIAWGPVADLTGFELLAIDDPDDRAERQDAADFLREVLADGPVPAKEVEARARTAGFSLKTVRRAARKLGVRFSREGFGRGARYLWGLPGTHAFPIRVMDFKGEETAPMARMVTHEKPAGESGDRGRRSPGGVELGGSPMSSAWHCTFDRGTGHLPASRADGSTFCQTCHPSIDGPWPTSAGRA